MTFDEAKQVGTRLRAEVKETEDTLRTFPRGPTGLVSDRVRTSADYRAAKAAFDRAFSKLRAFNAWFTKTFKKELRAERRSPRGSPSSRDPRRKTSVSRRDPHELRRGAHVFVAYPDSVETARVIERGTGDFNVRDYLRRADPYVVRTREGTFVAPRRSLFRDEFAAAAESERLAREV